MNYYTPTKERKTDVVLSQVLEGRVIQTLSILKGKNRGTAYIYMYMYMCVCINIYIYIYITRIYCKKSCPYSSEWNTPGYQSGPQSGVQILARGTCLRFFKFFKSFLFISFYSVYLLVFLFYASMIIVFNVFQYYSLFRKWTEFSVSWMASLLFSFTLKTRNCTATQLNFNKVCQK